MNHRTASSAGRQLAWLLLAVALVLLSIPGESRADRIKDVASVAGVRNNQLVGYGLVVGLDGTGDQTAQARFTVADPGQPAGATGHQPAGRHQPAAEQYRRGRGACRSAGLCQARPDDRRHRIVDRQCREPARRHAAGHAAARAWTARSTPSRRATSRSAGSALGQRRLAGLGQRAQRRPDSERRDRGARGARTVSRTATACS